MPDESFFERWEAMKAIDDGGRIQAIMREIEEGALALAVKWFRLSKKEVCRLAASEELASLRRVAAKLPAGLKPPEDPCEFAVWAVIDLPFALAGRRFGK